MHLNRSPDNALCNEIESIFFFHSRSFSACSAVKQSTDITDSTSSETESFRAHAPIHRSTLLRAQFPYRSHRAARCQICAGQGTTRMLLREGRFHEFASPTVR